jgi:hypothetical protein
MSLERNPLGQTIQYESAQLFNRDEFARSTAQDCNPMQSQETHEERGNLKKGEVILLENSRAD